MSKVSEKKTETQAARYYCQLYNEENRDKLLQWWRALDDVSGARAQLAIRGNAPSPGVAGYS